MKEKIKQRQLILNKGQIKFLSKPLKAFYQESTTKIARKEKTSKKDFADKIWSELQKRDGSQ